MNRGMNMKKFLAICLSVAVGSGLLIGNRSPALAEAPQYGGELNVALDNDAKSLDPIYQVNFSERGPEYLIFNTLFGLTSDFSIIPELAESWSLSDNGLVLTMSLRKGVKFHDGTDFDAEAVKWNLERRLTDAKSASKSLLTPVIASVEVVDTSTVKINLKTPSPSLLGMLAQREGFMISPTAAKKLGDRFGVEPVGTGPFIFKEWQQGNKITVEKNPAYWEKGKPYLDRVTFHLMGNPVIGVPRMLSGELDMVPYLTPNDARSLEGKPQIKLFKSPGSRWVSLHIVTTSPPFTDVRVRQAIAYALDRQRIVDIVSAGQGVIANGPTPPSLWWFDKDLPNYEHNPEKAKKLLAEAGYPSGLSLTLSLPPDSMYRPLASLVQEQLKDAGIKVNIQPVSASEWEPRLANNQINLIPIRWTQRPDPDGLFSLLFYSKSQVNLTRFNNSEVDGLLVQARGEKDRDRRREIYGRAQKIIAEQVPYVNLFFAVEYTAMQSNVQNFTYIPDEIPRLREVWKSK
jgi:peptide/nickel transport system substrate-binding protein